MSHPVCESDENAPLLARFNHPLKMTPQPDPFEPLGAATQEISLPCEMERLEPALAGWPVNLQEILLFLADWEADSACSSCLEEFEEAPDPIDVEFEDWDEEARARAFVEHLNSPEGNMLAHAFESLAEALEVALEEDNRGAIRSGWFGKPEVPLLRES